MFWWREMVVQAKHKEEKLGILDIFTFKKLGFSLLHLFTCIAYSPSPRPHQMCRSWAFKGVASQGCRAGSNPAVWPWDIPCISLSLQVLRCHLGKSQRFQPLLAGEKIPLAREKGVFWEEPGRAPWGHKESDTTEQLTLGFKCRFCKKKTKLKGSIFYVRSWIVNSQRIGKIWLL